MRLIGKLFGKLIDHPPLGAAVFVAWAFAIAYVLPKNAKVEPYVPPPTPVASVPEEPIPEPPERELGTPEQRFIEQRFLALSRKVYANEELLNALLFRVHNLEKALEASRKREAALLAENTKAIKALAEKVDAPDDELPEELLTPKEPLPEMKEVPPETPPK